VTRVPKLILKIAGITAFFVVCFVVGILLVNAVMNFMVGRGSEVAAPDLTGKPLAVAREMARASGFQVEIGGNKHTDEFPPDTVIRQRPDPGRMMKRGRPVQVVISLGPELATVPELRGVSFSEAQLALVSAGLTVGTMSRTHVPDVPVDAVVTTDPGPGEVVPRGSSVDLLVSSGPPETSYLMPDLSGRPVETAASWLGQLGLVPRIVRVPSRGRDPGVVLDHRPSAGERVKAGDIVELKVSR
jgi:eukaryotic-like serine/threonine-protein kinase